MTLELPLVRFWVSTTGTPSGNSRVRLPVSGTSGTVPMVTVSSPSPRFTTVVAAVSLESNRSSPPRALTNTNSTPRKVTMSLVGADAVWKVTAPVRFTPLPTALRVMTSGPLVPLMISSSTPSSPVSRMATGAAPRPRRLTM